LLVVSPSRAYDNPTMHSHPLLILALVFFAFFLTYAWVKRLPASNHMYRDTNRAHFNLFIGYTVTSLAFIGGTGAWNEESMVAGAVGTYVYFSLYYAFVFPLIGLARNSISINLLTTIQRLEKEGQTPSLEAIQLRMANLGLSAKDVRESRIYQLTYLGFAKSNGGKYSMTPFGMSVFKIMDIVLSIWKQRRL
jgi:hypothetical protein